MEPLQRGGRDTLGSRAAGCGCGGVGSGPIYTSKAHGNTKALSPSGVISVISNVIASLFVCLSPLPNP